MRGETMNIVTIAIARLMGGDATGGRDSCLVPGPGHGPADRSLSIKIDPTKPLGVTFNSFANDSRRDCYEYIAAALGVKRGDTRAPKPQCVSNRRTSEFPLQLFHEAVSAKETIVETRYLQSRRLSLPDRHEEVLKFHPSCPFGKGTRHPCMIALYRDIRTNEPKAIHRTALTPDGKKIGRMALGPKSGCAIKLTPDEDVTEGLAIGEGAETALAGMALGFRPAWALGDAGAVAKFPVLSGIECLTILVDNDASGTGQASAIECSRRWTDMGREVFRVVPTAIGTDIADVVSGRAA
jgi:putative DNA primase/helicase